MTDQELIELVRQKPPDELSSEEIDLLRQGMRQSASLRDALSEQMRLDHCLSAALGNVRVSVDKILATVGASARPPNPWAGWYGWGAGATLLLVISGGLFLPQYLRTPQPPPETVALAPVEPSTESGDQATSPAAQQAALPPRNRAAEELPAIEEEHADDELWLAAGSSPSDALAGHRIEIEAESFQRGNVQVDANEFGAGIGVIKSGAVRPSFVEHEFEVPVVGEYELEIRYAGAEPQPFTVTLAGRSVEAEGSETGGWKPDSQRWNSAGTFQLAAGKHVLRIDATGGLPHIDKLALTTSFSPGEDGPWTAGLEQEVEFGRNCFDDFDPQRPGMPIEDLKRWLLPVEWNQEQIKARPGYAATVDGLLRLRSPWPNHATLRLSLYELHKFRIHLWHGRRGVTLQYYPYPRPAWTAYATTRGTPKDVRPKSLALLATDSDRFRRSGMGTFEIGFHDDAVVMTRGDARLLTVPLAGSPEEVYFDGHVAVRELAMSRTSPLAETATARPVVVKSTNPAKMAWRKDLPDGAELRTLDDGRLELVGRDLRSAASATLPLGEPGLYEMIFQVENPLPGTGLLLADRRGRPIHRLGFFREHHSGATSLGFLPEGRQELNSAHDAEVLPAPFAGKRPWVRLVQGPGTIKCWISGDGEHWSPAFDPLANAQGFEPIAQIGLYALPGAGARGIRLRGFEVRELSAVTGMAAAEWKETPLPGGARDEEIDLGTWLQQVLESQPAGADAGHWRRTCAVRTLQTGTSRNLGNDLLVCLLHDGLATDAPAADRLRLLEEVSLLADTWQADVARKLAQELVDQYFHLGRSLAAAGEALPYSAVGLAALESPLWTDAELELLPEELIRRELFNAVNQQQWNAAEDLARRVAFWTRSGDPQRPTPPRYEPLLRLAAWAEASAQRRLADGQRPLDTDGSSPSASPAAVGRHPLLEELGKEAYNILAEFNAALAGQSYDEACRILSSARTERALGLLPDARDGQLLVSLAEAVQAAFRQHPELLRTMQQKFAPAGKVRVRQAAEAGDVAALEAATVQFSGTEAAAEAHLWLGDHALSAGDFVAATRNYRLALDVKAWSGRASGLAHLRLAAAMLGRDEGQPVRLPVDFGGSRLSPVEFEALVAQMRARRRDRGANPADNGAAAQVVAPPPAGYASRTWAAFDGPGASDPPSGAGQFSSRDPIAREIATTIAEGSLLVSNRVQTARYNLATGQKTWSSVAATGPGQAQHWLNSPMAPQIAGSRIFVRRLAADGPTLCCLNAENGDLVWSARAGLVVVSDPLLTENQLLCLTAEVEHDRSLRLSLTSLDPATGDIASQRLLTQVRDVWNRQLTCRLAARGEQLFATFGGCVLCCDMLGSPRWLRRQTFVPPSQDAFFAEQDHDPPLFAGQQMLVSQPGVRAVECLETATGRLLWRASLPRLQRVLGLAGESLVVRSADGVQGLELSTGKVRWQAFSADLLEASFVSADGVLIAQREPLAGGKLRPRLLWLDPITGVELGSAAISSLVDDLPALGPLVQHGPKTWAFFGRGIAQASRELVELSPQGEAAPARPATISLAGWTTRSEARWQASVSAVLPGWSLLSSASSERSGAVLEYSGQRDLFATQPTGGRAARLARWVSLPAGQTGRLKIHVGHDTQQSWRLEVRAAGRTLLAEAVSPQTAAGGWRELEVDLSSLAGQSFWLTVSQHAEGDPQAPAYWKRLELASTGP